MHPDPLVPPILDFQVTDEEQKAIEYALTLKDSWSLDQKSMDTVRDVLKSLRDRIKKFHLARQNELCCYCRTNLHGGGSFMVDREHIVPKSYCKELTYVITNLSVACKRCNLEIKKNKTNLFVHAPSISQNHLDESAYRIIHPNFERYEDFIIRFQSQLGTTQLVKFHTVRKSEKSDFMYEFFKLKELEVSSFDEAQGLTPVSSLRVLLRDALKFESENQPILATQILKLLTDNELNMPDTSQPDTGAGLIHEPANQDVESTVVEYILFHQSNDIEFVTNISAISLLPSLTKHEDDEEQL